MKRIPLKTIPMGRQDGVELNYREQLLQIMRTPSDPQRGSSIDEIRNAIRVMDALEEAEGDFVDFEDADYAFMKGKVLNARFGLAHPAIIQFVDDVTGAS